MITVFTYLAIGILLAAAANTAAVLTEGEIIPPHITGGIVIAWPYITLMALLVGIIALPICLAWGISALLKRRTPSNG